MEDDRTVKFVRFQPALSLSPPTSPDLNPPPTTSNSMSTSGGEPGTPFAPFDVEPSSSAQPQPASTANHTLRLNSSSQFLQKGVEFVRRGTSILQRKVQETLLEDSHVLDVFDPRSKFIRQWNKFFVCSALMAAFVDPLFFFLSEVDKGQKCVVVAFKLAVTVTVLRSLTDFIYLLHLLLQFRVAYVADTSRAFGTGDLVTHPKLVAWNYLKTGFVLDFVALLPLPQFVLWVIIPVYLKKGGTASITKNYLRLVVVLQYVPRVIRVFPLQHKLRQPSVVFETAWSGFVINLAVFMIAAHVTGACWYLLGIERVDHCWRQVCRQEDTLQCSFSFFDCNTRDSSVVDNWVNNTAIISACLPDNGNTGDLFDYGIYMEILKIAPTSVSNWSRYFYALWFGLKNLSSIGQNLLPSSFIGEILFCIVVAIVGLLLFASLVGNMQTYLTSLGQKLEQYRELRRDSESWMARRGLPYELRRRVREYDRYKWAATRGVEESQVLACLPEDLRRDIKRHLCLGLVRKVPLFEEVDDLVLDAICERLKPMWYIKGAEVIREGDPVLRMLFIIRGQLESVATGGGRSGVLDAATLRPGDFCGDELLTWCLEYRGRESKPVSARSITAEFATEAFALDAGDLMYVTTHFRNALHLKSIKKALRYHSLQWRTWAALAIQSAWRRYKARRNRDFAAEEAALDEASTMHVGPAVHAAIFASSSRRVLSRPRTEERPAEAARTLQRPVEAFPTRGRAFFDPRESALGSLDVSGVPQTYQARLWTRARSRSGPLLHRQESSFLGRVSEDEVFEEGSDGLSSLGRSGFLDSERRS